MGNGKEASALHELLRVLWFVQKGGSCSVGSPKKELQTLSKKCCHGSSRDFEYKCIRTSVSQGLCFVKVSWLSQAKLPSVEHTDSLMVQAPRSWPLALLKNF